MYVAYYVYVLQSEKTGRFYISSAAKQKDRLCAYNTRHEGSRLVIDPGQSCSRKILIQRLRLGQLTAGSKNGKAGQ